MAPTARSPPYLRREKLKQSTSRLSVEVIINGAIPSPTQGKSICASIFMFSFLILRVVLSPHKNLNAQTALRACETTVATAAPLTPIPSKKMNIGSSTIFATAPIITVIILTLENPWAEMNEFRPKVS